MATGTVQLREAFNAAAAPNYTATQAFMSYVHEHDAEFTVLKFVGIGQGGKEFTAESPKLRAGVNIFAAAADVARSLTKPPVAP